jgi:hypothetical protein
MYKNNLIAVKVVTEHLEWKSLDQGVRQGCRLFFCSLKSI